MIPIKSVTITTQGAIPLGRQGEHHAREIVFPQPDGLLDEIWTCFHRRARDREAYPVPLEKREGNLVWLVTSGDTGIPGNGQAELTCVDGSGAVLKTKVYGTSVEKALQDGGEVPDPVKPWYDAILKAIEEAQQGADGGYYTPIIQQLTESTMTVAFQPSQTDMPEQAPVTVQLPAGPSGEAAPAPVIFHGDMNAQVLLNESGEVVSAQEAEAALLAGLVYVNLAGKYYTISGFYRPGNGDPMVVNIEDTLDGNGTVMFEVYEE